MDEESGTGAATRERIVRAAADLLAAGGREAVVTRSVAAAAGVQAPTIYRQFGDMAGLLDAVASHGFAAYLREKTTRTRAEDPVEDLRRGWDLHVDFGLANPAFYILMYGNPRPGVEPTAAREAAEILRGLVQRVAEAGCLRIEVEDAARMIHAASSGVVLSLIATDFGHRDLSLSSRAREVILAAVTTTPTPGSSCQRVANRAVALKAVLPNKGDELTAAELGLLQEWLDRLSRVPA
jgi:AcrR family transcriptional regulator